MVHDGSEERQLRDQDRVRLDEIIESHIDDMTWLLQQLGLVDYDQYHKSGRRIDRDAVRAELSLQKQHAIYLEQDARRYRYLRDEDRWGDDGNGQVPDWDELGESSLSGFDEIVDARMTLESLESLSRAA